MGLFRINGVIGKKVPSRVALVCQKIEDVKLNAVKSIVASYDPFDERSIHTRQFVEALRFKKLTRKYPEANIKSLIKCDRSEPTISLDLVTGKKVLFKAGNLSALEMLELYNRHVTPHAPEEEKPRETLTAKAMRRGK